MRCTVFLHLCRWMVLRLGRGQPQDINGKQAILGLMVGCGPRLHWAWAGIGLGQPDLYVSCGATLDVSFDIGAGGWVKTFDAAHRWPGRPGST